MKDPVTAKQLLDMPFAPEADALLDELERSGQFRIGIEAEQDEEANEPAPSNDYSLGRGCGLVMVQDWWTTGRVTLHVGAGLHPADLSLERLEDSLVLRTRDGMDQVRLEGYLGLIPDASTLRVVFADGPEWMAADVTERLGRLVETRRTSGAS